MRIIVVPSDKEAPGYYRLGLPAMTLMDQGADIDFTFVEGLPMDVRAGEPVALHPDVECDVLILQRPMARYQLVAIKSAQARGIKVVVEVDDDLHAVDRRSAFGSQVAFDHLRVFAECCQHADLLTVSTPALAAKYDAEVVLPNYVPEAWLEIRRPAVDEYDEPFATPSPLTVGWTGSIGSHVADLQATRHGVGAALEEVGGWFRCFGKGNAKSHAAIERAVGAPAEVRPWQSRDRYPHEIAKFDVGIAPLENTPFNRAKSWLKPLEYAACGVPCVMSPTDEYRRLHNEHGIGALADFHSPGDWRREVERLLSDDAYRHEAGEKAREAVRESLTIEQNCWKWAEAWAGAAVTA